jgi:hypothetical protein
VAESLTPWGGTVTLTTANTAYQLSALLDGLAESLKPRFGNIPRVQWLNIQAEPDWGGTVFYWGNAGLSATFLGAKFLAGQSIPFGDAQGGNLIRLDQIYLMADTASAKVNVSFLTR